jgi:hypothetical protein
VSGQASPDTLYATDLSGRVVERESRGPDGVLRADIFFFGGQARLPVSDGFDLPLLPAP